MTDWRNQGWTDAKVGELKRLWAEGKSANEIGRSLHVTRNAVIGKVHRLGLQSVAREGVSPPGRAPKAPIVRRTPTCNNGLNIKLKKPVPVVHGDASKLNPEPVAPYAPKPEPLTPTATVLTIGSHMCRWPIGDPQAEGFGFCGRRADGVYCRAHAAIAYVPLTKNRTPNELARSLRRYC